MQGLTSIYISLGSNIEPEKHMRNACDELVSQLNDALVSPVYQSTAIGMQGADFLNAVIGGLTTLDLPDVVSLLREIETAHGRIRSSNKFSDRTLDLDLLLFGDCIKKTHLRGYSIKLPHPEITEQAYVIQPLADIAADVKHPISGLTFGTLCKTMKSDTPDNFKLLNKVVL